MRVEYDFFISYFLYFFFNYVVVDIRKLLKIEKDKELYEITVF